MHAIKTTSSSSPSQQGVIIGFPGTGFRHVRHLNFENDAFARLGYTMYEVNVRVYDTSRTKAECAIQDGKTAFKHILSTLEPNATRVFVYAGSAGGANVLHALKQYGHRFHAMALIGPLVDVAHFYRAGGQKQILPSLAYAKKYSPINNLPPPPSSRLIPPMHFFVGDRDTVTPFRPQLVKFATLAAAKRQKKLSLINGESENNGTGPFRIAYYAGAQHVFQDNLPEPRLTLVRQDIVRRAHAFFQQYAR